MNVKYETNINEGEILIKFFDSVADGKTSLADLGLNDAALKVKGGNLRLVIEFNTLAGEHLYHNPTIIIKYDKNLHDSKWICEINGETILDKTDHSGHSTILLLSKEKIAKKLTAKNNKLVIHGDLESEVVISAAESSIHLAETRGR